MKYQEYPYIVYKKTPKGARTLCDFVNLFKHDGSVSVECLDKDIHPWWSHYPERKRFYSCRFVQNRTNTRQPKWSIEPSNGDVFAILNNRVTFIPNTAVNEFIKRGILGKKPSVIPGGLTADITREALKKDIDRSKLPDNFYYVTTECHQVEHNGQHVTWRSVRLSAGCKDGINFELEILKNGLGNMPQFNARIEQQKDGRLLPKTLKVLKCTEVHQPTFEEVVEFFDSFIKKNENANETCEP